MASPRSCRPSLAAWPHHPHSLVRFFNLLLGLGLALLLPLALLATAQAQARTVLYVNKHAATSGDGLSWATAYKTLQEALDTTNANDGLYYEIWVAEGAYYPDEGGDRADGDRAQSFHIAYDNVQIYGGFAGMETQRDQRDWTAHPTILSGDIDGDGTLTDNAYHVVYVAGFADVPVTAATVLDGFTITGGNADGSGPDRDGGGLYCAGRGSGHACSPTLRNLTIRDNSAANYGGGVYNDGEDTGESSPQLADVAISANSAAYGGGMYNDGWSGVSSPVLTNVTISGNRAENGGGIYNNGEDAGEGSPVLTSVIISGNSAASYGGGMYNSGVGGTSSPQLTGVTVSGNRAEDSGGGMYNDGYDGGESSPQLTNVVVSDNSAVSYGGGMYNNGVDSGVSSPQLTGVTVSGNRAEDSGGGMYNNGIGGVSSPQLTNVIISGNRAEDGGGMVNAGGYGGMSSPQLTNVTITGNSAAAYGGGMYNDGYDGASSPEVRNSILWGNTASSGGAQMYDDNATPSVSYSDVQGGQAGTGNLDADPLFAAPVAASSAPTTTGDYRLLPSSPAINAGTNAGAPATDIRGLLRPVNLLPDMGAYETQGFTLAINGGDAQTTTVATPFAQPLTVQVSSAIAEPVGPGSAITITPPPSGPGLNVTAPFTLTTDAAGVVTVAVKANSLAGSYGVTATAGSAIVPAVFRLINAPLYLTAAVTGSGSGSVTSTPTGIDCGSMCKAGFDYNAPVTLAANVAVGSTFSSWSGACSGTAICTVTMTETKAVTATFALNQYTVSVSADPTGGGNVSGGGAVNHGEQVTVTAVANSGYTFVNWTEGGTAVSTSASYSFTATGSRTLVANFRLNQYTVTVSADPAAGGNVSGGGTASHGDSVTVAAVANTGYTFDNWTEGGTAVSTSASFSFTATGSRTLVAHFRQLSRPLAHNDAAGVLESEAVDVDVLANDEDPAGRGLVVTVVTQPAHGTVRINAGGASVRYTSVPNSNGEDSFTYTVQDANGLTSTGVVAIVIAPLSEAEEPPQLAVVNPAVQNSAQFTSSVATVQAQLLAGFYTGTVGARDVFFLAYTPIVTPTEHTLTPPAALKFGNFEFHLTAFLNEAPLHGVRFAQPVTLTIRYDPALLKELKPETLQLLYWNGKAWSTDGIGIVNHNIPNGTLTVTISHLSEFAFFAAAPPDVDTIQVYLPMLSKDIQIYLPTVGKE